jgi:hypothetical protein
MQLAEWVEFLEKYAHLDHLEVPFGGWGWGSKMDCIALASFTHTHKAHGTVRSFLSKNRYPEKVSKMEMNSQKMAYVSIVVTQTDQQWECRPSLPRGETIPLIFAVVGAGSLCGAVAFWQTGIAFVRVAFCIPLAGWPPYLFGKRLALGDIAQRR